jgi:NAD(P)H dehydrogenase (quinone)
MEQGLLGITGASGGVGGRVARRLAAAGVRQRLILRDPSKAPALGAEVEAIRDYGHAESVRAALTGVGSLLFVPAGEHADRVSLPVTLIDAALDAGVERFVYVSFLGAAPDSTFTFARDHFATEEHIRARGVAFTFLRCSLYLDFIPLMCGADGVIRGPAGDGRFAPAARDDIADVAVAVLASRAHDGRSYDITGPQKVTMRSVADELTRAAGRRVTFVDETLDEARASRASSGAPNWEIEGWVTTYAAIAAGELDVVSDTVPKVSGHPAMTIGEYLAKHPESVAHLRSE